MTQMPTLKVIQMRSEIGLAIHLVTPTGFRKPTRFVAGRFPTVIQKGSLMATGLDFPKRSETGWPTQKVTPIRTLKGIQNMIQMEKLITTPKVIQKQTPKATGSQIHSLMD